MTDTDIASLDNQYTNDIKKLFTNSHEEELIIKYDKNEYMDIKAKKFSGSTMLTGQEKTTTN